MAKKTVVIAGATGYLGRYLVQEAHRRGHKVRALVRSESRLGEARGACDEVFVGDATAPESLRGLCDGADVVITSLGVRTMKRKPTCFDVDYRGNLNIVKEAKKAGVGQFVFVSVLGAERGRRNVPQMEARERVVDTLKAGELPWTIIRPTGFFNDMAEFFNMAKKGRVWIVGDGSARVNPIHGADLAEVCLDAVGEHALGSEIPAGGPEVLTTRQIAETAFDVLGRQPRISGVPPWLLALLGRALQPINLNVASLMLMMAALGCNGAATDRYGTHHLRDFYRELAA